MDKVIHFIFVSVLCFSVIAIADVSPETGQVARSKSINKLKGSHLRLDKTGQEERKSNQTNSETDEGRSARNAPFEKRPVAKIGQNEYSPAYENDGAGNDDFLVQYLPGEYPNEKYVYFESGGDKPWNYPGDAPDARAPRPRPVQPPRRPFEKDSCRQYLEFLKYAFEQIESSQSKFQDDDDYYNNYDYDYSRGEGMVTPGKAATPEPPLVIPDALKLRSLAFTDNYETENAYSYVRKGFVNETETESAASKGPEEDNNRRTAQSTDSSELGSPSVKSFVMTIPSTEEETNTEWKIASSVTPSSTVRPRPTESKTSETPSIASTEEIALVESQKSHTVEHTKEDGCQDKLFPCPDNMNVTYPVNGYCNRFVVCESGKPNSEFCQEGLHFNLVTKKCDLPHNSFCTYSCPKANGYFAVPGDCGGFFRCSDWYPEYRMCPPRMHWDSKAKICTFRELSSCPLKCDSSYQVKPYDGACGSYIICTKGAPSYHTCPDGTNFDKSALKCMPEDKSQCEADPDYVTRNQGIENGRKTLCATVELKGGKSKWCQDTRKRRK